MNEQTQYNAAFDTTLNTTTDFFVGWGNRLTLGTYVYLGKNSYLSQVNTNSTAYHSGEIIGAIHFALIGALAGSGPCQVGSLIQAARTYTSLATVVGGAQVGYKAWTQGAGSLTVFEWLALAPAAGKVLAQFNRMCFVAGTPVAVDWLDRAADRMFLADMGLSSSGDIDNAFSFSFVTPNRLAWGAVAVGALLYALLPPQTARKHSREREIDRLFSTDLWNPLHEPHAQVAFA